jgi:hypothetical protein
MGLALYASQASLHCGLWQLYHLSILSSCWAYVSSARCPRRLTVIVKHGPLKKRTTLLTGNITGVAPPHISTAVELLLCHASKDCGGSTSAYGSEPGVEILLVVSVSDVQALVSGQWVRIDCLRCGNGVFPFFLHLTLRYQVSKVS